MNHKCVEQLGEKLCGKRKSKLTFFRVIEVSSSIRMPGPQTRQSLLLKRSDTFVWSPSAPLYLSKFGIRNQRPDFTEVNDEEVTQKQTQVNKIKKAAILKI